MGAKKRGISPVIAVVLLIMITVIAAGIIVAVVVPFTKDNLSESKACFEVLEGVSFAETPYNCYIEQGNGKTGFSVRIDDENIVGFRIALQAEGSADSYSVENSTSVNGIRMLNQPASSPLVVPQNGGVRTYVATGAFERAEIYPILPSGARCDLADSIVLPACEGDEIISSIAAN